MLETITKSPGGSVIVPVGLSDFPQPKQTEVKGGQKCNEYKMYVFGDGDAKGGLSYGVSPWKGFCAAPKV